MGNVNIKNAIASQPQKVMKSSKLRINLFFSRRTTSFLKNNVTTMNVIMEKPEIKAQSPRRISKVKISIMNSPFLQEAYD